MTHRMQLIVLVTVLLLAGIASVLYKHYALGFPINPAEVETVWTVEARIAFKGNGDPITVRLRLPDSVRPPITTAQPREGDYRFSIIEQDGQRLARWRADGSLGEQVLRLRFTDNPDQHRSGLPGVLNPPTELPEALSSEAQGLVAQLQTNQPTHAQLVARTLNLVNVGNDPTVLLLLGSDRSRLAKVNLAVDLLRRAGVPAQVVRGVELMDNARNQSLRSLLEVHDGERWHIWDDREAKRLPHRQVLILGREGEPMLDVFGGTNSSIQFATLREQRGAFQAAVDAGRLQSNVLVDFSIYSLPLADQSAFKLLLMIPIGALVVVLLRNIVGLRTSGTFMPVLIALAFQQTTLLVGVMLFLVVVGIGLLARSYLSRLNLLLVPRIAAVLVTVIVIYGAIGIVSHKLGMDAGLRVMLFPMVILSWTIERMSILWEEDGPREVFIQGGGSLITAVLAYLLMSNRLLGDILFLYPELLLVVLAIVIMLGRYSGYRLTELRRFEPMERY
jgi:hypothetical protein